MLCDQGVAGSAFVADQSKTGGAPGPETGGTLSLCRVGLESGQLFRTYEPSWTTWIPAVVAW